MTHATILRKAALALQKYGFAVGTRRDFNGAMCALGALDFAICGKPHNMTIDGHSILPRLITALRLPIMHCPAASVASWSNATDKSTVVRAFRRVAAQWSKRGR